MGVKQKLFGSVLQCKMHLPSPDRPMVTQGHASLQRAPRWPQEATVWVSRWSIFFIWFGNVKPPNTSVFISTEESRLFRRKFCSRRRCNCSPLKPTSKSSMSPTCGLLEVESGAEHAVVAVASNGRSWGEQSQPLLCRLHGAPTIAGTKSGGISPHARRKTKVHRASGDQCN